MITEQSAEFWRLYGFYQKGVLCVGGGIYDQPSKYMEAMKVIEQQVHSE